MRVDEMRVTLSPGEILITPELPIASKCEVFVDGVKQNNVVGIICYFGV